MRIVILGTAYPYRGGLASFNERLARQFISEGHEVEIITFTLQYPSLLFPGKTQYSTDTPPQDLMIKRKLNAVNPVSWIKTGNYIKNLHPDILIIKFWIPHMAPCFGKVACIVKSNNKTNIISILDNVLPHENHFYDKPLIQYFVNSIDAFIAMSDKVLQDLALFNQSKPKLLCPHPLYDNYGSIQDKNEARKKLNLPPNNTILLFFGFIRDYKGLDLLMKAYADKRIDKMKTTLVVAGEFYNNKEQYKNLERQLGLEGTIRWFDDFIPNDEVSTFFSACDIVVQPYKSATQSGVTQIAYHFNKPMLVTNVGGLAELVPDGKVGYVVQPNPDAIADAIVQFLSIDPDKTFAQNIELEKQKYAWGNMTKAIINVKNQISC